MTLPSIALVGGRLQTHGGGSEKCEVVGEGEGDQAEGGGKRRQSGGREKEEKNKA